MLLALWPAVADRPPVDNVPAGATALGPAPALPLAPTLRPDVTTVERTATPPTAVTGPAPAPLTFAGAWTVTTGAGPSVVTVTAAVSATCGPTIVRRPAPPTCTARVRPGPATLRALALAAAVTASPATSRSAP